MTVTLPLPRARGDPPAPGAAPASATLSLRPNQPPPPPASIPPNFRPAFLGFGPLVGAGFSASASGAAASSGLSRPACRSSPSALGRRLASFSSSSSRVSIPILDTPSTATCGKIKAALAAPSRLDFGSLTFALSSPAPTTALSTGRPVRADRPAPPRHGLPPAPTTPAPRSGRPSPSSSCVPSGARLHGAPTPTKMPSLMPTPPAPRSGRPSSSSSCVPSGARHHDAPTPTTMPTLTPTPLAPRSGRLQSLVVGTLVLVPPPPAACERVNDDRSRVSRGDRAELQPPPAMGALPAASPSATAASATSASSSTTQAPRAHKVNSLGSSLKGILRSAASKACAPARPPRSVSFCIPAPSESSVGSWGSTPAALSAPPAAARRPQSVVVGSMRLSTPPAAPAARDSGNTSPVGPWIQVLSRRARYARGDGPSLPRRSTSIRHSKNSNAPQRHPRSRHRRPRPCFRCQATDHDVVACRDPVRCAGCRRWGHRARDCVEPPRLRQPPLSSPPPTRHRRPCPPSSPPCPTPPTPPPMRSIARRSNRDREGARGRSPRRHKGGSDRHDRRRASPLVAPRVRPTSLPRQRATPVSPLRSFADVLLARPEMDVCYNTSTWVVLASERCYKVDVDEALSAENERAGLGLLQMQGEEDNRKACEMEVHTRLSPAVTGEVLSQHEPCPALACSPLLIGHDPLLSLGASLTMGLLSPDDALCDGGFSSDDDEDDGEMQQLLPCLTELDQQVLLLDDEEVAHEDGLDNDNDLTRIESQPVADGIDVDVEAATLGNLLAADTDDDADDDVAADAGGAAPSSGTVIRCVADLFSRPAVSLLPTPTPPMPCAPAALPAPDRRSSRLATKPQLLAVDKAQYVLHKKMGLDFGDMPLVKATKEFANICKSRPFSASAIDGLNTLFRLKLPSMTALDEALIGLAGPGGCDFPPPAALDVSV